MTITKLTETKVGAPSRHAKLAVFPLTLGTNAPHEAKVADETLQVSELPEATVPQLQVHNPGKVPMLIPAGRVLEGGRQTRTVNVSILVPAGATITIPVSCVEAGRWSSGHAFRSSGRQLSRKARIAKERGVSGNLFRALEIGMDPRGAKHSDQGAVWDAVGEELHTRRMSSPTSRFDEVYEAVDRSAEVSGIVADLVARGPEEGQTGVAIAYGGRVVGIETFRTTDDLRANWESIVRSAALELTDAEVAALEGEATVADVEEFLRRVAAEEAITSPGTGIGTEWHVSTREFVAHALADESGEIVHAYAFAEV